MLLNPHALGYSIFMLPLHAQTARPGVTAEDGRTLQRRFRGRPAAHALLGGSLALASAGPLSAAPARPAQECVLDERDRGVVREHNTKAKQEFEEDNFLAAADQWLKAGEALPTSSYACAEQHATRVELALRSLQNYIDALRYDPADRPMLDAVRQALDAYAADPERADGLRGELSAVSATLACLSAALPDNDLALDCTEKGRASRPKTIVAPAPPPQVIIERAPDPRIARRRRSYAIGLGVSAGLGGAALAAGVATWVLARTGGSLHREVFAAAQASVADDDPLNDVPPNLPASQNYCEFARTSTPAPDPALLGLCDRHDKLRAASITSYAIAGLLGAAVITFAALYGESRQMRRTARRPLRLELGQLPGGLWLGGAGRF